MMPGGEKGILAGEAFSLSPRSSDPPRNIPISSRPIKPEQQKSKEYEDRFFRVFGGEPPHIWIDPSWTIPWLR